MCNLGAPKVVEPDGALELVSGVQQQDTLLGGTHPRYGRGSSRHPGKACAVRDATAGKGARLLHARVHIVGVQDDEVPGGAGARSEWKQQQEKREAQRPHLSVREVMDEGGSGSVWKSKRRQSSEGWLWGLVVLRVLLVLPTERQLNRLNFLQN